MKLAGFLNCVGTRHQLARRPLARHPLALWLAQWIGACSLGLAQSSLALPQGGQVVAGSASLSENPASLQIDQQSQRAIINYDSFSIGANERVDITQPSADAVLLNRVIGADLSRIDGQLNANGQVILVNQNGIVFSAGSQVNTGGLIASTLDISNQNFMNGRLEFEGDSNRKAQIIQNGEINISGQGSLGLLAPVVVTNGDIHVAKGDANLVSANALLYQPDDSPIAILVEDPTTLAQLNGQAAIQQNGNINATRVNLSATAESAIYSSLIEQRGDIKATGAISLNASDGDVIQSGKLDVSATKNSSAGNIQLNAGRISQRGQLLAKGLAGASELHAKGGSIQLTAADTLVLENGSLSDASGAGTGDAGQIINISPNATYFRQGSLLRALGGDKGGDGGFIEVSGINQLEFLGSALASSNLGKAGLVYIDPIDLEIRATGTDNSFLSNPPNYSWDPNGTTGTAIIAPSAIQTALIGGTSVSINTALGTGGAGNITFYDPIDIDGATNGASLTFIADGNINFTAGSGIYDSNTATDEQLFLTISGGANLTMASGSFLRLGTGTMNMVISASATLAEITSTSSDPTAIEITAGSDILDDGDTGTRISVRGNGSGGLFLRTTNGIGASDALELDVDSLQMENSTGGLIDIEQTGNLSVTHLLTPGDIRIVTSGQLNWNTDFELVATNSNITLNAAGNLNINNRLSDTTGPVDNNTAFNFISAGNFSIADGVAVDAGAGNISATISGDASISGLITRNTALNAINITAANILDAGDTLNDFTNTPGGATLNATDIADLEIDLTALDLTSAGAVTLHQQNASALNIQNISVGGNFALDGVGTNLTLSDTSANFGGDISLSTVGNAPIIIPDTGLAATGNINLIAGGIRDSDNNLALSGQNLTLNLSANNSPLNLTTSINGLQLNLLGSGQLNLNNNLNANILGLVSTQDVHLVSSGDWILPDAGLSTPGIYFALEGQDIYSQNSRTLILNGDRVYLHWTNGLADSQLTISLTQLDVEMTGNAGLNINTSNGITLTDLNGDGFAALMTNTNLNLQALNGDLSIDGNIRALDTQADGNRRGTIELASLAGDLWLGANQSVQIQSLNAVDSSANSTLGSALGNQPLQTSIYFHLGNNTLGTRQIHLGSAANSLNVETQGGDINIDATGASGGEPANLQWGTNVSLSAYNASADAQDGLVLVSGTQANQAIAGVSAKTARAISLNPYIQPAPPPPPPPPTPTPTEPDVDAIFSGIADSIKDQLQPPPKQTSYTNSDKAFDAVFGQCQNTRDQEDPQCTLETAIKAFLSKWTLGGDLPPRIGNQRGDAQ